MVTLVSTGVRLVPEPDREGQARRQARGGAQRTSPTPHLRRRTDKCGTPPETSRAMPVTILGYQYLLITR